MTASIVGAPEGRAFAVRVSPPAPLTPPDDLASELPVESSAPTILPPLRCAARGGGRVGRSALGRLVRQGTPCPPAQAAIAVAQGLRPAHTAGHGPRHRLAHRNRPRQAARATHNSRSVGAVPDRARPGPVHPGAMGGRRRLHARSAWDTDPAAATRRRAIVGCRHVPLGRRRPEASAAAGAATGRSTSPPSAAQALSRQPKCHVDHPGDAGRRRQTAGVAVAPERQDSCLTRPGRQHLAAPAERCRCRPSPARRPVPGYAGDPCLDRYRRQRAGSGSHAKLAAVGRRQLERLRSRRSAGHRGSTEAGPEQPGWQRSDRIWRPSEPEQAPPVSASHGGCRLGGDAGLSSGSLAGHPPMPTPSTKLISSSSRANS
ncbi:hypothetical protein GA0070214_103275 [Micromonospora chaiyaphumensis]|uniref:Uncharacterized protein n=1 Tax=Micromonospora chaiyaphumensis TaxID=307119 RepID=A0A1C4W6S9_9ACTN|nr:hypothetical protein GA0070214_103275 [Micromonospora chaiyaphumensis]